ncbi:hypothetical protein, partial [Mesorhizobium sp.]|uniref:hypothetical protein n=1 Tax=Mesorhizobium sp. TaxID=1871066 RepID=UPI0025BC6FAB
EWDRVQPLRHNHQVGKTHVQIEKLFKRDQKIIAARSLDRRVFCAKATFAFCRRAKPASATARRRSSGALA